MKSSQQDKYSILSRESEADIIRNDGITLCEGTVRAHPAEKLLFADEPHPRRPRCQYCGEMIQMDAYLHPWFGRSKTTSIPQAKGRIERLFQTLQSRLLIISLKCLCRERRLTMSCDMRGLSAGRPK